MIFLTKENSIISVGRFRPEFLGGGGALSGSKGLRPATRPAPINIL
jgi:hypothetical protein